MLPRTLEKKLRASAAGYPVVVLTGPRQSGKTMLAQAVFPGHRYLSLEDPDRRDFAKSDPRGFLAHAGHRAILDEVQRVPDLFSYIQTQVDERKEPGQYILTGSQQFLLMDKVSQSLAGRAALLRLLPLSLAEIERREPFPLAQFGKRLPPSKGIPGRRLWETLFRGFYPRIHDQDLDAQDWLGNYFQTYIERDVRQILNVGDLESFGRFVRLCAGRHGQILNFSSLAMDAGVTHTTARRWLSVLEASFLVHLLRPYHRNFNKRVIKSPKLYFLDSGLLCYLLRIASPEDLEVHAARGAVFEGFVVAELLKKFANAGHPPDLSFWRDSQGHEVDVIVETSGPPVALEIKSGATVASDFIHGLRHWHGLPGNEKSPAALVYGGDESSARAEVQICSWRGL